MVKVTFVLASSDRRMVDVEAGTTVMEAAVNSGIDGIVGECGGSAMHATCHVHPDFGSWRTQARTDRG